MERCVSVHRFGVLLCLSLFLTAGICGRTQASLFASAKSFSAQMLSAASKTKSAPATAQQRAKGGEYVLSHDRYEKAVSYSRAAYVMYFVSVGLNVLALLIILRLGIAAKFRDLAESVSDKRWIQALVFVPLLVVL